MLKQKAAVASLNGGASASGHGQTGQGTAGQGTVPGQPTSQAAPQPGS